MKKYSDYTFPSFYFKEVSDFLNCLVENNIKFKVVSCNKNWCLIKHKEWIDIENIKEKVIEIDKPF